MVLHITNAKDHSITLRSFDGDSVIIPAKARHVPIADKFDWHAPSDGHHFRMKRGKPDKVDPTQIVKGKGLPEPAIKPPKTQEEAIALSIRLENERMAAATAAKEKTKKLTPK